MQPPPPGAEIAQYVLLGTLGVLALERGAELIINARNTRELRRRGAVWLGKDGFKLILTVQVLLFVLLLYEVGLLMPWVGVTWWWTGPLLAVALLLQVVRYWVIATLGWRWTIRVATVPGEPRVTTGPYRFLRHPNYAVVLLETLVIPLAFNAIVTLLVVLPLNAIAIRRRIRLEETALRALPEA